MPKFSQVFMLVVGLILPVYAWDEFQPIAPREVDMAFAAYQEFNADASWSPIFKAKVGLAQGLDLEYAQPLSLDADVRGLGQPDLGLKWGIAGLKGVALLVAMQIPVGTESVVGTDPDIGIDLAVVFEHGVSALNVTGIAGYSLAPDTPSKGTLHFYLDPQYPLGAGFSTYAGLNSLKPLTNEGPTFGFWPGIDYAIRDNLGICADFDIDLPPRSDAIYGLSASIYGSF